LDYTIGEQKKNVALNPSDSFMQMTLSQILNLAASFNVDKQEKFSYYSNQAEEAINKSIAGSPGRVPIYFIKAQIFLTRGDKDKAIETLKYGVSLSVYRRILPAGQGLFVLPNQAGVQEYEQLY
jgi:hypothetical protein